VKKAELFEDLRLIINRSSKRGEIQLMPLKRDTYSRF
jgi:hypothetical protein